MDSMTVAAYQIQAQLQAEAERLRFTVSPRVLSKSVARQLSGATGRPPRAVRYSRSKYR